MDYSEENKENNGEIVQSNLPVVIQLMTDSLVSVYVQNYIDWENNDFPFTIYRNDYLRDVFAILLYKFSNGCLAQHPITYDYKWGLQIVQEQCFGGVTLENSTHVGYLLTRALIFARNDANNTEEYYFGRNNLSYDHMHARNIFADFHEEYALHFSPADGFFAIAKNSEYRFWFSFLLWLRYCKEILFESTVRYANNCRQSGHFFAFASMRSLCLILIQHPDAIRFWRYTLSTRTVPTEVQYFLQNYHRYYDDILAYMSWFPFEHSYFAKMRHCETRMQKLYLCGVDGKPMRCYLAEAQWWTRPVGEGRIATEALFNLGVVWKRRNEEATLYKLDTVRRDRRRDEKKTKILQSSHEQRQLRF